MEPKILDEINNTAAEMKHLIASFSNEELNTIPFEGSWTGGQVVDHVLKSIERITKAIYGTTRPTDRDPTEKIVTIRAIFLNFDKKLRSPEFIIPEPVAHDKEKLLESFSAAITKVTNAINSFDLTDICLDFELPGLGQQTRIEWVHFILYHTQRHNRQLKNILGAFKAKQRS